MKNVYTPAQLRYYSNFYAFGFVLFLLLPTYFMGIVGYYTGHMNYWFALGYAFAALFRALSVRYKRLAEQEEAKLDHFKSYSHA